MSIQFWISIIFVLVLFIIVLLERKKIKLNKLLFPVLYLIIYKSKHGIKWMDKIAKSFPRLLKFLGFISVIIGFLGMAFICFALLQNTVQLFTRPEAAPGVQPVLPVNVKGVFFVPFLYWILAIFVIAVIHEFAHGVMARLYNMRVKSSGFLAVGIFLPIIPAAFVEPDDKQVVKKPAMQQMAMFASGAFSNILFAGIILVIMIFAVSPIAENVFSAEGMKVVNVVEASPAGLAGLQNGEVIRRVNGVEINSLTDFTDLLADLSPGDEVTIKTDKSAYTFALGESKEGGSKPYLGISTTENFQVKPSFSEKYGKLTGDFLFWTIGLLNWLFLLSLGIGLFNLIPVSVIDGGRMFRLAMQKIFEKKKGDKIWKLFSYFFFFLIIVNILFGFLK